MIVFQFLITASAESANKDIRSRKCWSIFYFKPLGFRYDAILFRIFLYVYFVILQFVQCGCVSTGVGEIKLYFSKNEMLMHNYNNESPKRSREIYIIQRSVKDIVCQSNTALHSNYNKLQNVFIIRKIIYIHYKILIILIFHMLLYFKSFQIKPRF